MVSPSGCLMVQAGCLVLLALASLVFNKYGPGGLVCFLILIPVSGFAIEFMIELWSPEHPPCPSGRCRRTWRFKELNPGNAQRPRRFQCRCGQVIQSSMNGDIFAWLEAPDGTRVPYMRKSYFGRWRRWEEANDGRDGS